MRHLVALPLVILTIIGCTKSERPTLPPVSGISIVFSGSFGPRDQDEIVEAINETAFHWANDFGRRPDTEPFNLIVVDKNFECGGVDAIGCTRRNGDVWVVRGGWNEIPALYHEFCHRAKASRFHGTDTKHEDASWPRWTDRSYQIANDIANRRNWLGW